MLGFRNRIIGQHWPMTSESGRPLIPMYSMIIYIYEPPLAASLNAKSPGRQMCMSREGTDWEAVFFF